MLNFHSSFSFDFLFIQTNIHHCGFTCKKGLRPNDGRKCRLDYGRPLVTETCINPNTKAISLKRDNPMVVPYNPGLSVSARCNTAVEFIASGVNAKATMYYITDYITKSEINLQHILTLFHSSLLRQEKQDREQATNQELAVTKFLLSVVFFLPF